MLACVHKAKIIYIYNFDENGLVDVEETTKVVECACPLEIPHGGIFDCSSIFYAFSIKKILNGSLTFFNFNLDLDFFIHLKPTKCLL